MYAIYANIWGILMVNVTIYSIHGSYGIWFFSIYFCCLFLLEKTPSRSHRLLLNDFLKRPAQPARTCRLVGQGPRGKLTVYLGKTWKTRGKTWESMGILNIVFFPKWPNKNNWESENPCFFEETHLLILWDSFYPDWFPGHSPSLIKF